jgi:hypothetical protein
MFVGEDSLWITKKAKKRSVLPAELDYRHLAVPEVSKIMVQNVNSFLK